MPSGCSRGHVRCLHGVLRFWDFIEHRVGVVENWGFVSDGGRVILLARHRRGRVSLALCIKHMSTLNPLGFTSEYQWPSVILIAWRGVPTFPQLVCVSLDWGCCANALGLSLTLAVCCAPEGPAFLSLSGSPDHPMLLSVSEVHSPPGSLGL